MEERQKKALEVDPTIFDYDGLYDEMKQKVARSSSSPRSRGEKGTRAVSLI